MNANKKAEKRLIELSSELALQDLIFKEIDKVDENLLQSISDKRIRIEDSMVYFECENTRNEYAVRKFESQCQVNGKTNPEKWMDISLSLIQFDKILVSFLEKTCNSIDPFFVASEYIKKEVDNIWQLLVIVRKSIQFLNSIDPITVIQLYSTHYDYTKTDLMHGIVVNELGEKLKSNPNLCMDFVDAVRLDFREQTSAVYTTAIISLSETDANKAYLEVSNDLLSKDPIIISNSLWSLGQLNTLRRLSEEQSCNVLKQAARLSVNQNEIIRYSAFQAIAKGAIDNEYFAAKLKSCIEQRAEEVIPHIVKALLSADLNSQITIDNLVYWVESFYILSTDQKGTTDDLDAVLSKLVRKGYQQLVIKFIDLWIVNQKFSHQEDVTKLLEGTFSYLFKDLRIWSQVFTTWLVNDSTYITSQIGYILTPGSTRKLDKLRFCSKILSKFNQDDFLLLIRRMLGFVHYEADLISLCSSLLKIRGAQKKTYSLVEETLTHEIGIDYPEFTIKKLEELREKTKNTELTCLCNRVIKSINAYLEPLSKLSHIRELRPNPEHVQLCNIARNNRMRIAQKEAEENSILRQLVTTIPMKSGVAQFSFFEGQYSKPSSLHTFNHSVSLPRRFVFDSVGTEMNKSIYRLVTKETK